MVSPTPRQRSKLELLYAAEEEFAKHGLDGGRVVSIAARSGSKNRSAVSYYFHSVDNLLLTLMRFRFRPMVDYALWLESGLQKRFHYSSGAEKGYAQVLSAMASCHWGIVSNTHGRYLMRFINRFTALHHDPIPDIAEDSWAREHLAKHEGLKALVKEYVNHDDDVLELRMLAAERMILHGAESTEVRLEWESTRTVAGVDTRTDDSSSRPAKGFDFPIEDCMRTTILLAEMVAGGLFNYDYHKLHDSHLEAITELTELHGPIEFEKAALKVGLV